jgi:hypothetical protein
MRHREARYRFDHGGVHRYRQLNTIIRHSNARLSADPLDLGAQSDLIGADPRDLAATGSQVLAAGISKSHPKSQCGQTLGSAHRH